MCWIILKLNHRCLNYKPDGDTGIFRNWYRRSKKLSVNVKLGDIKCRQLIGEGKNIAQNSELKTGKRISFFLEKYGKTVRIILNKGSNTNSRNAEEFHFNTELKL